MESKDKALELKCNIDKEGTLTCDISKENFNNIQKKNIKPKKVVFEINDLEQK